LYAFLRTSEVSDEDTDEGCPICGKTEEHEHEFLEDGALLPIDLDSGPKFGSQMRGGHWKITFGHEMDGPVLFETNRKEQAHLIHMALTNAQTDEGLVETLVSNVNRVKQTEVYGSYFDTPMGQKFHAVVWLPEDDLPKILRVLDKAGEHGLAALMRQGHLDWRKGRPDLGNPNS